MKTLPPAVPAAGPPTWPPSAPPSSRPSRKPGTCTCPKADATTPPRRNPLPPRPRLGQTRTITEHAGALQWTPTEFEVLGVRSTREMASSWMQRTRELSEPPDNVSHSERHAGHQRRPRYPWEVRGAGPYSASGP